MNDRNHYCLSVLVISVIWLLFVLPFYANADALNNQTSLPNWQRHVVLVTLADGRLMSIGATQPHQPPSAHIWNPANNNWLEAGQLTHDRWDLGEVNDAQALALPNGNVLRIENTTQVDCDIWQSTDQQWTDCSDYALIEAVSTKPGIGIIEGGLVLMITSLKDAFVLNQETKQWKRVSAEWNQEGLSYGAPVWNKQPLMRIFDENKKVWIDASGVAGKFWQNVNETLEHEIIFSDRPTRVVGYQDSGPSLFWDEKKIRWTYLFLRADGIMGKDPVQLPDGCIFTWHNLRLFNPITGKVKKLKDPGINVDLYFGSMTMLPNGVAAFAGLKNHSANFYTTDLSCNGFAKATETTSSELPKQNNPSKVINRIKPKQEITLEKRWIIFKTNYLSSVLTTIGLIVIVFLVWRQSRTDLKASSFRRMVDALQRLLAYGLVLIFALNALKSHIRQNNEDDCELYFAACLNQDTGLLRAELIKGKKNESVIPCKFLGIWATQSIERPSDMYRTTLKENGEFEATRPSLEDLKLLEYKGHWAVQGNYMVWRDFKSNSEADINLIEIKDSENFILTEGNGRHTNFRLIEATPSNACR